MTGPRDRDGRLVPLYDRHHEEPPVVTIVCGAERGRCRQRLGTVWATPVGLLLHYRQHVAPRRLTVDTSGLTEQELARYLREQTALRRFEPGQSTGIGAGLRDQDGCLALLDVDRYWDPAELSCWKHDGLVELDRQHTLDVALRAVRSDRHDEMRLRD